MPDPLVLDLVAALVEGGAPPRAGLHAIGVALRASGDPRGPDLLLVAERLGRPLTGPAGRSGAGLSGQRLSGPGPGPVLGPGLVGAGLVGTGTGTGLVGAGLVGLGMSGRGVVGAAGVGGSGSLTGPVRSAKSAGVEGYPAAGRLAEVVEESLGLAARSGLPPTSLLRRSADEERRRQATAQLRAVRRLEVLLVVPAGLCLLPAFVLLGIVPAVLDLVLG